MKNFVGLIFLSWVVCFDSQAQLRLSQPINRAVYQAGANSIVTMTFGGQWQTCEHGNRVQYRIVRISSNNGVEANTVLDWTYVPFNSNFKTFFFNRDMSRGWYKLEFRVLNTNNTQLYIASSTKFGVGDVYLIAGQSNASGVYYDSGYTYYNEVPQDAVIASSNFNYCSPQPPHYPSFRTLDVSYVLNGSLYNNYAQSGLSNWAYTVLGNRDGGPVLFFNTAIQNTSSLNWQESANGLPTNQPGIGQVCSNVTTNNIGFPYRSLQQGLNYFASTYGVRAVLWHQGENDNVDQRGSEEYHARMTTQSPNGGDLNPGKRLKGVIPKSREDFNANLSWVIARASRNKVPGQMTATNWPAVTNAQTAIVNGGPNMSALANTYLGPNTDLLGDSNRNINDRTHFEGDGLKNLGEAWKSFLPAGNPVSPLAVPQISMSGGGGNFTFTAPGGYNDYCWRIGMTAPSNCLGTGTNFNVSGTEVIQCYMKTGNNWVVSNMIVTNEACPAGSRQAKNSNMNTFEENEGMKFTTFPNPYAESFTVSFSVDEPESAVRLELYDVNGRHIQTIVDSKFSPGRYTYPQLGRQLPAGSYIVRLAINTLYNSRKVTKQ